jgi:hypothetical protein
MRAATIVRAAASVLLALSAASLTAHAQGPLKGAPLQTSTPITKLQAIRIPKVGGDNTAAAITAGIPNLYAFMSAVPGNPKASVMLRNMQTVEESANGKPPMFLGSGGMIWLSVGNAPAGYYHVRFDGAPSGTTMQIHLGQNASAPVVATCQITSDAPYCDVVVSNPGGAFSLAGVVTSGTFQFWDVYVAPTTRPLALP